MQFYHAEAAERNALQGKHLRAFEYLGVVEGGEPWPLLDTVHGHGPEEKTMRVRERLERKLR